MLKSNYLRHVRYESYTKLKAHLVKYVSDYNEQIPHSFLNGRTPEEAYYNMPNEYDSDLFISQANKSIRERISSFKKN